MKISKHISYKEAIRSRTAILRGIRNTPGQKALRRMKSVAENVFEPLREWAGGAIRVNSFYRSPRLNSAIGGAKSSDHMKGYAIDLDDVYGFKTNAEMFWYIVDNLTFDKIIWEFGDKNNPNWVHVSYRDDDTNRGIILRAHRYRGRVRYSNYSLAKANQYLCR